MWGLNLTTLGNETDGCRDLERRKNGKQWGRIVQWELRKKCHSQRFGELKANLSSFKKKNPVTFLYSM